MGNDQVKKYPRVGRAAKKCGRPTTLCHRKFWDFSQKAGHILPQKILGFLPKFPYKLLNSLLPLIWKFGTKILKKGNPKLGITTLFRSRNPDDVIVLAREN
jgi:hypothetical protein